jgi:uncharacterized protein (UPF0333 family)
MLVKPVQKKRKGSVLVEYALLIAGIVLVSVVAIAVLGHKVSDNFGLMAVIMPGAHAEDNSPIASANTIPFEKNANGNLTLKTADLINNDRVKSVVGAGAGETLIVEE